MGLLSILPLATFSPPASTRLHPPPPAWHSNSKLWALNRHVCLVKQ